MAMNTLRTVFFLAAACGFAGCAIPTITVNGSLINTSEEAAFGVDVCVEEFEDVACGKTGGQGGFVLNEVPAETEMTITLVHPEENYRSQRIRYTTPVEDVTWDPWLMVTLGEVGFIGLALGVNIDADLSEVLFAVTKGPLLDAPEGHVEGVTGTLTPASGEGPYFMDGDPDPDLEATSDDGIGFFFNVGGDEATLDLSGIPDGCTVGMGWGEDPTSLVIDPEPRFLSAVRVECPAE